MTPCPMWNCRVSDATVKNIYYIIVNKPGFLVKEVDEYVPMGIGKLIHVSIFTVPDFDSIKRYFQNVGNPKTNN